MSFCCQAFEVSFLSVSRYSGEKRRAAERGWASLCWGILDICSRKARSVSVMCALRKAALAMQRM
jgi:hypothetical protein